MSITTIITTILIVIVSIAGTIFAVVCGSKGPDSDDE